LKKILILTAGFGEGHNAAARGLRDAFQQLFPGQAEVELHDLFAETYGRLNDWARRSYIELINRAPQVWAHFYRRIDRNKSFAGKFGSLYALKDALAQLLAQMRPDVVVTVYPVYAHLLEKILGPAPDDSCRRVVIVTDSITVNAIWYRCSVDCFLVPNEPSAAVLRAAGIAPELIRSFGFPVNPQFAAGQPAPPPSSPSAWRVLYMINAGKAAALAFVRHLVALPEIQLTVTVGRDKRLRVAVEGLRAAAARNFEVVGWCKELPQLMQSSHLLVSKAGGATVQETIAAGCPMIINQIVPGQEEGNAHLIVESGSGAVITNPPEVAAQVQRLFANNGKLWREWAANIRSLSKPDAALDIARFLMNA
jgi:processive 1,2-diacylglycerol beta-glucosyltransferase